MTTTTSPEKPTDGKRAPEKQAAPEGRGSLWLAIALGLALALTLIAMLRAGLPTVAAIFFGAAGAALVWVVRLFVASAGALLRPPGAAEVARATGRRRKELEREKWTLLKALKELEFDYQMGKLSEVDYREIRTNYRARATRVIMELDGAVGGADYRALVERDVKARRESAAQKGPPHARE